MSPRYALVSVFNKNGIVALAKVLTESGFTLLSTGGTAALLESEGLAVTRVATHTGAPELMGGRVKTLHPRIHGGILGDREQHASEATHHDIPWIELVVCNLYPFEQTTQGGATLAEAVEQIDIGGPTMVRAAAKNHAHVTVLVDPDDYERVGQAIRTGQLCQALRGELAVKAFRHTARYDAVVADWLAEQHGQSALPAETALGLRRLQDLRYGENPHQRGAFYADAERSGRSLARAVQHQGGALSFNNLADLDGALRCVFEHPEPACAIIKHMNPAGCATGPSLSVAFERALAADPVSAYGGIVVFNRPVAPETVRTVRSARTFFEVLAAPGFEGDARERLAGRQRLRVLELPADWGQARPPGLDARRVQGGWLLQDWDLGATPDWKVVTTCAPTEEQQRALAFAWATVRAVKSNGIVLARALPDGAVLNGVGAGQMSRVDAVFLALRKATLPVPGSVLASDAFFPFADGIQAAAAAGVCAVVQPGGSIRDSEVIEAADAAGIAMVFTGVRHFRH